MDQLGLGEKIRDLRRRMKLTQTELAEPEFTKSFISQIEKGQTRPSLRSLQIIATKLNQPVSYFLGEADSLPPQTQELMSAVETAGNLCASGLLNEAIGAYNHALTLCKASDHPTKGALHLHLGRIYMQLKQYRRAIDAFTLSVNEYKQTAVDESLVHALDNLGTSKFALGRFSEARRWFDEALAQHTRLAVPDVQLRLRVLANLANVLFRLELHEEASQIVEPAIRISADEGGYYKYGELCQTAGVVLDALGKHADALRYTDRAITFYSAVDNQPSLIASQIVKGAHLRKLGRLDESKEIAQAVLERTKGPDLVREHAQAHAELAFIHSRQSDFDGCLHNVKEALRLAPSHENLPAWTGLVVECARHTELPQSFLDQLEQLVDRWHGETRGKAELHSSLGELYRIAGSTSKATDHLAKSVAYFKQS